MSVETAREHTAELPVMAAENPHQRGPLGSSRGCGLAHLHQMSEQTFCRKVSQSYLGRSGPECPIADVAPGTGAHLSDSWDRVSCPQGRL